MADTVDSSTCSVEMAERGPNATDRSATDDDHVAQRLPVRTGAQQKLRWHRVAASACVMLSALLIAAFLLQEMLAHAPLNKGLWKPGHVPSTIDMIVMIRTHAPMRGMLERIAEDADDLAKNLPHALFMVSIDTSKQHEDAVAKVRAASPSTVLHVYNWRGVLSKFPAVPRDACHDFHPTGWNYHAEPISLAVSFARQQFNVSPDAKTWVLEDDVFFCPKNSSTLSDFLKHYTSLELDFLSGDPILPVQPSWWWTECCSSMFADRYQDKRFASSEMVTRWSSRLLEHVDQLLLQGVHAHSEMFGPTVCTNDGFKTGRFNDEDIGHYSWGYRLSRSEAEQVCAKQVGPTINHAGKFFADAFI